MNSEGDEIYFQEEPALVGKTYGQALLAYEGLGRDGIAACEWHDFAESTCPNHDLCRGSGLCNFEDDDTVIVSGLDEIPLDESAVQNPERISRHHRRRL